MNSKRLPLTHDLFIKPGADSSLSLRRVGPWAAQVQERESELRKQTAMAQYTITYFQLRGRSETMRLLLADQGAEWKEEEVSYEDWLAGKVPLQKKTVFGQLPRLSDGDFILYQSNAILRYLGRKYELYGKNIKEASLIDMANDGVEDIRMKFYKFFFEEWETGKEKYMEELPNQLRPYEQLISQNPSGFIVGGKVSFADYGLLDHLHNHLCFAPDCLKDFPHLTAFKKKMEARPNLKAYLESEGRKNRPIHPTRKL